MRTQSFAVPVAVLFAVFGLARSALAVDIVDDPVQIDERAAQVVQTSNSLCWEMYRYHRQKPDYPQAYREAKELWRQAGALRDSLQSGLLETESLRQQVSQMNDRFVRLDQELAKWGDGDRSMIPNGGSVPRTVVTDGVVVDLPLIGVQVGGPRVAYVEDDYPALQRRRLHPNSHGTKRSLEREMAALKLTMSYLLEDTGFTGDSAPPAPGVTDSAPVPQPPDADEDNSKLRQPEKVLPRGVK
jgi:hypothetical protein